MDHRPRLLQTKGSKRMTDITIGLLSFPALLLAIFLRVPIGLAMFLAGFFGLILVTGDALSRLHGLNLKHLQPFLITPFLLCRCFC